MLKKIKKVVLPVLLLSVIIALTSCSKKVEVEKISVGIQNNVMSSMVIIASEKGYFKEVGLDVDVKPYPSGKLAFNAMLENKVELATVADMPFSMNAFKRNDYYAFAEIAQTNNGAWIIARKDKGINKPEDLKGKTIATQEGSAVHYFMSSFLLLNRIPEDEMKIKFMKAVKLPDELIEGRIDAFSMRNPFIKQAKDKLGENAIEFFDKDAYTQHFILTGKRDIAEKRPQAMENFLKALLMAEKHILEDKQDSIKTVMKFLKRSDNNKFTSEFENVRFSLSLDHSLIVLLEAQARWSKENNSVKDENMPEFTGFIDGSFMKKVNPDGFNIIH